MDALESRVRFIVDQIIWGWPLIILLIVASIYFGFKTRFVQIRYLKLMPKLIFEKNEDGEKISAFQSMTLIIGNHVGTGNIIGVAIAILYGGPGAVFWMWVVAILCSVLSFIENTLGQMYKVEVNGEYRGGAAYYISEGLGSRFWAIVVSFMFFICIGLFMPTIQTATISYTINHTFLIPKYIIGLFVSLSLGYIIIGNSKRIVCVSQVIVPFMAVLYLFIAFLVILVNIESLPHVFQLIFQNAWNKDAVYGCLIGKAVTFGIRRGLFSNEAGVGSSPNISASTNVSHPVKQGLLSTFGVFFDTIIICTSTALMILVSGKYNVICEDALLYEGAPNQDYGQFVESAINTLVPNLGGLFVALALFMFAYTSLFGSFYNAQTNLIYLFKSKRGLRIASGVYKVIFLMIIFISSFFSPSLAWEFTDIGMGIAALLNLIVLFIMRNKIIGVLKDFEVKYKKNEKLNYENKELDCWKR